jgi:hypothetical protein
VEVRKIVKQGVNREKVRKERDIFNHPNFLPLLPFSLFTNYKL